MNEDAVQALKEAMEPPDWWTNRARLTAREVVRRLQEHGYTVARESDVRTAPARPEEWNAGFPQTAPVGASSPAVERQEVAASPNGPASTEREADQQMLAALMADLESSVAAVRDGRRSEEAQDSQLSDEQRESA